LATPTIDKIDADLGGMESGYSWMDKGWHRGSVHYLHRLLVPLAGRAERAGFDRAILV
jgi:hypothetical protein